MKYTQGSFSVAVGSDAYRDNWDRVFGAHDKAGEPPPASGIFVRLTAILVESHDAPPTMRICANHAFPVGPCNGSGIKTCKLCGFERRCLGCDDFCPEGP